MAYARARKHYRVAQKEVQQAAAVNNIVSPKNVKKQICIFSAASLFLLMFGMLVGYLIGHTACDCEEF